MGNKEEPAPISETSGITLPAPPPFFPCSLGHAHKANFRAINSVFLRKSATKLFFLTEILL